jgi:hypothetical protein
MELRVWDSEQNTATSLEEFKPDSLFYYLAHLAGIYGIVSHPIFEIYFLSQLIPSYLASLSGDGSIRDPHADPMAAAEAAM